MRLGRLSLECGDLVGADTQKDNFMSDLNQ